MVVQDREVSLMFLEKLSGNSRCSGRVILKAILRRCLNICPVLKLGRRGLYPQPLLGKEIRERGFLPRGVKSAGWESQGAAPWGGVREGSSRPGIELKAVGSQETALGRIGSSVDKSALDKEDSGGLSGERVGQKKPGKCEEEKMGFSRGSHWREE